MRWNLVIASDDDSTVAGSALTEAREAPRVLSFSRLLKLSLGSDFVTKIVRKGVLSPSC